MKATVQDISVSMSGFWNLLQAILSFRQPMPIAEVKILLGSGYASSFSDSYCSINIEFTEEELPQDAELPPNPPTRFGNPEISLHADRNGTHYIFAKDPMGAEFSIF